MNTEQSGFKQALGYGIRGSLFAAAPAYLLLRGTSLSSRGVQAIVVVYGPPLVILGAGFLEASVRTVAHLVMAFIVAEKNKQSHREGAMLEGETALKLLRGAVMPIDGYAIVATQVYKYIHYSPEQGRSLIQDYYVYQSPFIVTKHTYTYIVKPICKNSYVFVIKPFGNAAWTVTEHTFRFGFNVLDAVGFWRGVTVIADYSLRAINAGVGLAMKAIGR